jgi:hypothetical protein
LEVAIDLFLGWHIIILAALDLRHLKYVPQTVSVYTVLASSAPFFLLTFRSLLCLAVTAGAKAFLAAPRLKSLSSCSDLWHRGGTFIFRLLSFCCDRY